MDTVGLKSGKQNRPFLPEKGQGGQHLGGSASVTDTHPLLTAARQDLCFAPTLGAANRTEGALALCLFVICFKSN